MLVLLKCVTLHAKTLLEPLPHALSGEIVGAHLSDNLGHLLLRERESHHGSHKMQVEDVPFLDVVVRQRVAIMQFLAPKNQALRADGNALDVFEMGLELSNGVRRLVAEGDGLACAHLDEDRRRNLDVDLNLAATSDAEALEGFVIVFEGSSLEHKPARV